MSLSCLSLYELVPWKLWWTLIQPPHSKSGREHIYTLGRRRGLLVPNANFEGQTFHVPPRHHIGPSFISICACSPALASPPLKGDAQLREEGKVDGGMVKEEVVGVAIQTLRLLPLQPLHTGTQPNMEEKLQKYKKNDF